MAKRTMNFENDNKDGAIAAFTGAAALQQNILPKKEKKDKTISITLRPSDLEKMNHFCDQTGMSRSNLIRIAVAEYINNRE